nr:flagellar biosynthetic protein FliO [Luteimonas sp. Y-2-2-4F]
MIVASALHVLPATTAAAAAAVQAPPAPVRAETVRPASAPVGAHAPQAPGLGGAFVALVLVLGLILGLAWLLKRLPGGGFRQADGLRVVASIPLGAKERAAVVQVGDEQLLLGIGAGGVRTLHRLPRPLPESPPVQLPSLQRLPDFRQLLAQRLRRDA